eukprot:scaffold2739_cov257-Pinguiococcus_pyrenoidosus.AAC.1
MRSKLRLRSRGEAQDPDPYVPSRIARLEAAKSQRRACKHLYTKAEEGGGAGEEGTCRRTTLSGYKGANLRRTLLLGKSSRILVCSRILVFQKTGHLCTSDSGTSGRLVIVKNSL